MKGLVVSSLFLKIFRSKFNLMVHHIKLSHRKAQGFYKYNWVLNHGEVCLKQKSRKSRLKVLLRFADFSRWNDYNWNSGLMSFFSWTVHCVKSVRIWNFSGPYFREFRLDMEIYRSMSCLKCTTIDGQSLFMKNSKSIVFE